MGYSREAVLGRMQTCRSRAKPANHGGRDSGSRGGKLQAQRTLEDFTVAKVPQWTKDGLMEHIIELVVVDDQVRKVTSFM